MAVKIKNNDDGTLKKLEATTDTDYTIIKTGGRNALDMFVGQVGSDTKIHVWVTDDGQVGAKETQVEK